MDKDAYVKLLKGCGKQYKNTNLYMLDNKGSTVEERAAGKICPPPKLNPDYAVNPKQQRVGKITAATVTTTNTPRSITINLWAMVNVEQENVKPQYWH